MCLRYASCFLLLRDFSSCTDLRGTLQLTVSSKATLKKQAKSLFRAHRVGDRKQGQQTHKFLARIVRRLHSVQPWYHRHLLEFFLDASPCYERREENVPFSAILPFLRKLSASTFVPAKAPSTFICFCVFPSLRSSATLLSAVRPRKEDRITFFVTFSFPSVSIPTRVAVHKAVVFSFFVGTAFLKPSGGNWSARRTSRPTGLVKGRRMHTGCLLYCRLYGGGIGWSRHGRIAELHHPAM